MTAIVICSGSMEDYSYYRQYLNQADYIICADGGAAHARKLGVLPDTILGDFDSIPTSDFEYYKSCGVEMIKYPAEKDMTDSELALRLAVQKGYQDIVLLGGLGTRFDHSLANIYLLKSMHDLGARCRVIDENNEIMLISDKACITREEGFKVTLLPLTPKVEGVTTWGLLYELNDAILFLGSSLGVSNEFSSQTAEISIKEGILLLIKSRD